MVLVGLFGLLVAPMGLWFLTFILGRDPFCGMMAMAFSLLDPFIVALYVTLMAVTMKQKKR